MKRFCFSILAGLLTACSTPLPPRPPASTLVPRAAAPEAAPSAVLKPARIEAAESPMAAFERIRAATAADSVYFDFEGSAIKSDQTAAVSEHSKLAIAFSNDHVTLQGNCDERGSREYNLALCQRRADAVKQSMILLGVPQERIETISFGKEKPRALCHEQTCWAENRRADFVDEWK
ncbi:MAG: peptidoglycan-associated lipoprotein Pal [Betaproteobacteria bacterium]|nr:MAG: peptidoglycan-associated lipoprotein Pal [Betaproteobacteria bacterium]